MRPDATALVGSFAESPERFHVYQALVELGAEALEDLIPLFRDPKSQVRLWAVHSLACNHCKGDVRCPVDVVPLLVERAETDQSMKVRRMAVIMLATEFLDARARPVFERIVRDHHDRKLRLHAETGLRRLRGESG